MSTMAIESEINIQTLNGALIQTNNGPSNSLKLKGGDIKYG